MNGTQKGNVLFYILIAIVAFAALSYSITRDSRMTGNLSQDTTFAANGIMQYGTLLENAVETLLSTGTQISQLSFENGAVAGYTNAAAADANKVFHAAGGGLTYVAPEDAWLDSAQSAEPLYGEWYFAANVCVPFMGSGDATCNADGNAGTEDIVVFLPYIKKDVCLYINRRMDIAACAANDPCDDSAGNMWPPANTKFTGSFADGEAAYNAGGAYLFKTSGCLEGSAANTPDAGTYTYFKVLLAR
jgi:hypothetical protein